MSVWRQEGEGEEGKREKCIKIIFKYHNLPNNQNLPYTPSPTRQAKEFFTMSTKILLEVTFLCLFSARNGARVF